MDNLQHIPSWEDEKPDEELLKSWHKKYRRMGRVVKNYKYASTRGLTDLEKRPMPMCRKNSFLNRIKEYENASTAKLKWITRNYG